MSLQRRGACIWRKRSTVDPARISESICRKASIEVSLAALPRALARSFAWLVRSPVSSTRIPTAENRPECSLRHNQSYPPWWISAAVETVGISSFGSFERFHTVLSK